MPPRKSKMLEGGAHQQLAQSLPRLAHPVGRQVRAPGHLYSCFTCAQLLGLTGTVASQAKQVVFVKTT
jgi:hypothetical protein